MKLLKWSTAAVAAMVAVGIVANGTSAYAIVGGQDATGNYPGTTALSITFPGLGTASCAGTLIAPRFVLTAAHCVSDQQSAPTPVPVAGSQITARVGSNDRTAGGVTATGVRVLLHPDWMWGQPTGRPVSDLALVQLDRDIHSVPLMPIAAFRPSDGVALLTTGWGMTTYPPTSSTDTPTTLQQRDVTMLPVSACAGPLAAGAGESCISPGACLGDGGSPAMHRTRAWPWNRPMWTQVGLGSRATNNTDPCGQPTVYTDVTYPPFRAWILLTVKRQDTDKCTCPPLTAAQTASTAKLTARLKLSNLR